MLFALLGRGCEEVTRVASADADVVTCRWSDGRIGTMRALRPYSDYGAQGAHGSDSPIAPAAGYDVSVGRGHAGFAAERPRSAKSISAS